MNSSLDEKRGRDHGVFIPLKIMYPDADIPCVQLSLLNNLDPAQHIKIVQLIQELNYDNLLVIGSGFSFHNMKAFFTPDTEQSILMNESFEKWLLDTCSSTDISEEERTKRLIHWADAPAARFCHPREEHLLPLHVCYSVALSACSEAFKVTILNKSASMYLW